MEQTSEARILYTARGDATREREIDAVTGVSRFVLDCHAKKNPAAGPSERGDYDGKAKGDSAGEPIIRD